MSGDLTAERWQRIEALFTQALELDGPERDRWLDEQCSDDPALREEVAALLHSADTAGDYFSGLAGRIGVPGDAASRAEGLVGKRIGSYRVERLLGRGGMGAVYLVERDDEQFEMQGALKLLPMGLVSDEAHRRFRSERQILARMEHPNIARLFDGGVTDDGTPYFVMEHVEGTPIDEYCDERGLGIPQRLELFLEVCRAVEHAHRNLIVHRDLKPDNILVTESGDVKLLDFGIARVLEADGTDSGVTRTGLGHAMTPSYASPEQVRGEPVTTASDVYALGVLLYRLLTGRHPYRLAGLSPREVERIICQRDPEAPSAAVLCPERPPGSENAIAAEAPEREIRSSGASVRRLRGDLAGDLDAVVLTALRKEPERRYASVSHFADDIRRYQTGHPVAAHKDTFGYRASRFVRRNKAGVGVAAAFVLLLGVLAVTAFRFAITTAAQSRAIAREVETAEQVSAFLTDLFEVSDPNEAIGDTVTARFILDRAAASMNESLVEQPEVRARLLAVLGDVYLSLGLDDDGLRLHRQALTIRSEVHDRYSREMAESLYGLGQAFRARRAFDSSAVYYSDALEIRRRLDDEPLETANAMGGLALALRDLGQLDSAEVLLNRALETRRLHWAPDDPRLTTSLAEIAFVLRAKQEYDSAQALYEEVADHLRSRSDSGGLDLARTLNNLGYLYRARGQYGEAERVYRDALTMERRWGVPANEIVVLSNLASAIQLQGRDEEAVALLQERLEMVRANWPPDHWRVGSALTVVGVATIGAGDTVAAEPYYREAVDVYGIALGIDHAWTANAKSILGGILRTRARFEEAQTLLLEGYEALALAEPEGQWTADARARLADLYEAWGKPEEAERYASSGR